MSPYNVTGDPKFNSVGQFNGDLVSSYSEVKAVTASYGLPVIVSAICHVSPASVQKDDGLPSKCDTISFRNLNTDYMKTGYVTDLCVESTVETVKVR